MNHSFCMVISVSISGASTGTAGTANAVPLLTQARPAVRYAVPHFSRSMNIS